jgi:sugar lactone lactonase YvrE
LPAGGGRPGYPLDRRTIRGAGSGSVPWGKNAEPGAGGIYLLFRGELRRLYAPVTIPNAISFAPDRSCAYFADTPTRRVWRQPLAQEEGWPERDPVIFLDLEGEGLRPDGAVVDSDGCLWNAQYGAGRIARYAPDGQLLSTVNLPAANTTCPSFGGPGLSTLYITFALQGLSARQRAAQQQAGMTFAIDCPVAGQAEHRVLL